MTIDRVKIHFSFGTSRHTLYAQYGRKSINLKEQLTDISLGNVQFIE